MSTVADGAGWTDELHRRVDELIDEYRTALHDSLDDVSDDEARRTLVPSKTTLLGLVKHATFVEGVWFDQAITGRSYREIGIDTTVDGSFTLSTSDTVASVQEAYRDRWAVSRSNLAERSLDEMVEGRGARPVWALKLQVLRELAQHAGHADILREQIVASRSTGS
ncbi:MAG: DinB family protein [Ilumatobacteraceae bacterium]